MNAQIIVSYTSTQQVETNSFENSCSVQKRLIINCFWFQWVLKLWGQIHVKMVSVAEEIHMKLHENKEPWLFVVKLLQKADRHMKQKRNALSSSCWCERVHALEMLQISFDVWTLRVVNFWCELTNAPEERNCNNWRWTAASVSYTSVLIPHSAHLFKHHFLKVSKIKTQRSRVLCECSSLVYLLDFIFFGS